MPVNDNTPPARTPSEHRAAVSAWASTAPAFDGSIFGRTAHSKAPRLAALASQLAPLLDWRRLREAAEAGDCGSNWLGAAEPTEPANDNESALPLIEHELHEDSAEALIRRLGSFQCHDAEEVRLGRDDRGELFVRDRRTRRIITSAETIARYEPTRIRTRGRARLEAKGALRIVGGVAFAGPEQDHRTGTVGYLSRDGAFMPLHQEFRYRERSGYAPPPSSPITPTEAIEARDELHKLMLVLNERTVVILDAALRAETLSDVGAAIGAPSSGRRAIIAACKELEAARNALELKAAA